MENFHRGRIRSTSLIQYLYILGIEGFFGGAMCFNMGLFSYLADTTTEQDRTFRMSLLTGLFNCIALENNRFYVQNRQNKANG